MQKGNKTKHNQTNKHKYYSNILLNRYVIKNNEVGKIRDVFNPYFIKHTRKINSFTIHITLRLSEGESTLQHKIDVTNYVTYQIQSEHFYIHTTEPATDFLHRVVGIKFSHR